MHLGDSFRVPALARHHSPRLVYAGFVLAASATSIGTITAVAYWSGYPLVVPSLGPTAFLVFNRSQTRPAQPRNIIVGHLIGAAAGYIALMVCGLTHSPPVTQGGLTPARIAAAAISIGLTTGAMIVLRAEHGPAGATTLIVSLGFMTAITSLGLLMAGVAFLAVEGVAIDRLVGLHIPFWSGRQPGPHSTRLRPLRDFGTLRPPSQRPPRGNGHHPRPGHRPTRRRPVRTADNHKWIIGPGQGRRVLVGPEHCTVKVEDALTDGTYSLLEVALDPGPPSMLLHAHYAFAETYIVIEGQLTAQIADENVKAAAGSIIHVPPGLPHAIGNTGQSPAHCLCITSRSQQSEPEFIP